MRKFRLFSFAWLKMSQWSCTLRCQGLFLLLLLVSGWLLHGIRSSCGFGLGLTSRKWRLNTNKQKKMQNCRTTLWARLCIAVISLSLSVFFLFLIGDGSQNIYTDIEMSRRKHRTVLALARDEEQFEAGRSAGKPWRRPPFILWILSCFLSACFALEVFKLSCFGAVVLACFMLYVEDGVSFDFEECIGSRILSFFFLVADISDGKYNCHIAASFLVKNSWLFDQEKGVVSEIHWCPTGKSWKTALRE